MVPSKRYISILWVLVIITMGRSQWVVSGSLGQSFPASLDMTLNQQGYHYRLNQVAVESRSFSFPLYYWIGIEQTVSVKGKEMRFGVKFLHDKIYVKTDHLVKVLESNDPQISSGSSYPFDRFLDDFSISHGLNQLFLTASISLFPKGLQNSHWHLWGQGGVGVVIPHMESRKGEVLRQGYQFHLPAFMGQLYLENEISQFLKLFLGAGLTQAWIHSANVVEGSISLSPMAIHLWGGLGFTLE